MKLGLGTVQFGLDYGITNSGGRTTPEEVRAILAHAAAQGIETIDTAALYGNSEEVLGATLAPDHNFQIVTKTLTLDASLSPEKAVDAMRLGLERSLDRLGQSSLYGILVHRVDDLLGDCGDRIFEALIAWRAAGLIEKIGVSLYTPSEAHALTRRYALDLIQLPLNPFDQRHLQADSLAALAESGVEIHVRSAFLQGLLLAPGGAAPTGLAGLNTALERWQQLLAELGLTPLQACLGFLKGIDPVNVAVCGATSLAEWAEIVAAYASAPSLPTETFKKLAVMDDKLIDPRYWPKR